ncbi:MAG: hypothetical protein ABF335_11950 [Alphaproteobacteria bacterium]
MIGKTFWPTSTGKDTLTRANHVQAREQAATRRRAARHGPAREAQNAERRRTAPETGTLGPQTRADRLQARVDRASPPKINREPGKFYITGHRVGGAGPYHTAIEYTPDTGEPSTFSAAPDLNKGEDYENGTLEKKGILGNLQSNIGREEDSPEINKILGTVQLPEGINAEEYLQNLRQADEAYCDCVDYDFFPEFGDSHNSNSYIRGILEATGAKANIDWDGFVGGRRPVPPEYFKRQKQ